MHDPSTDLWEADAIPAATVVVVRDAPDGPEILMLLRDRRLAFAGGTYVFPGGRIDEADRIAAGAGADTDRGSLDAAARVAAVREAEEEAGLTLDPTRLRRWSHWTPPPALPRRFSTAFFVAEAPVGEVVIDDGEIRGFSWWTAAEVLRRQAEGLVTLTPPTYVTLEQLRPFRTVADILDAERPEPVEHFVTHFIAGEDAIYSVWHGDASYPDKDPATEGPRHRLVMTDDAWQYLRDQQ